MAEGGLRLFAAIGPPPAVRGQLRRAASEMGAFAPVGTRWAAEAGIHLTLKFIGNRPAGDLDRLRSALTVAAGRCAPFALSAAGAGAFPARGAPRVLWAGVTGDLEALTGLRNAVEEALVDAGCTPETQPFRPHLTLGRIGADLPPDAARSLRRSVRGTVVASDAFVVDEIGLYRSELRPSGSAYTRLGRADLRAAPRPVRSPPLDG